MSAREGANGGGSVREDGLSTVSREGVATEQCLWGRGGAGGNRGSGPIKGIIGTANGAFRAVPVERVVERSGVDAPKSAGEVVFRRF